MWNKIFILSLSACMALTAMAQDQPVGIRVEASEYEVNDEEQYTIFSYLDESGVYGYYLSLAHNDDKLTFFTEGTSTSIGVVDEVGMWLGADREAAFAMMDTLLALFDREEGTTVNFAGRAVSGGERLGVQADINCVVKKKLLGGKRLWFYFDEGARHRGEVYLSKTAVKQLRWGLKMDRKLHPNKK
jgi:hypothetical protein